MPSKLNRPKKAAPMRCLTNSVKAHDRRGYQEGLDRAGETLKSTLSFSRQGLSRQYPVVA